MLMLFLTIGYYHESFVLNFLIQEQPFLLPRAWVLAHLNHLAIDPRLPSSLLYFFLFTSIGSLLIWIGYGKQQAKAAICVYLFLGAIGFSSLAMAQWGDIKALMAIGRSVKSFYSSLALPLIWIAANWLSTQLKLSDNPVRR